MPGFSLEPFNSFATLLYRTSLISVDLPDPETPVMHVNTPSGIFTLIFFKLFCVAPNISIAFPFDFLRFSGNFILFLPLR